MTVDSTANTGEVSSLDQQPIDPAKESDLEGSPDEGQAEKSSPTPAEQQEEVVQDSGSAGSVDEADADQQRVESESIPQPDEGNDDFDVQALEAPLAEAPLPSEAMPLPALSTELDEGGQTLPPPGPDFDPSAVRNRIQKLKEENTTPVRAGRSQAVSLGAKRPKHFGAAELKEAADKPIDWAVKHLWTRKAKILLASEPKAGKTWLVCAIALAICSGSKMFEGIEVVDPGPVGIIAAEDEEGEIGRRFDRMCRAKGMLMSNLDLHWWSGDAIRLNRPRDIDWIREQVTKYGIKMMIYDPLARLMDGDENSKECVSGVLTPASTMVNDLGCSVMIVHHLGKDDPDRPKTAAQRVRGSSDIRSWYTTGMFLSGQLEHGQVQIEMEQRVRGRLPTEFPVKAVEVEEQSVYGLGTMKLVAKLEKVGVEGNNELLVKTASRKILELSKDKGWMGLTTSEIGVHLRMGRQLMNAALKQLIREEGELEFEAAPDIPDGKILVPVKGGTKGAVPPRDDVQTGTRRKVSKQAAVPANSPPEASRPSPNSDEDEDALFGGSVPA